MPIPVSKIITLVNKYKVPLAAGAGGTILGSAAANALNGGSNTPQQTTQDGKFTVDYQQYIDSSSNISYNITSGGSTLVSTDTAANVDPSTNIAPSQSASTKAEGGSMLLPALAVGGALVLTGVLLWQK